MAPPRTREELLSYGVMDPAMTAELAKNPIRAPQPSDPYYGQQDFAAWRAHRATTLREKHHLRYLPGPIPDAVSEEDVQIRARDGAEITVRVYRPVSVRQQNDKDGNGGGSGSPLIVMYHEGAWSMGDLTDEEVNCRLFSRDVGAVCVNVAYRLAPEHPFPTWLHDSWDALQWAAHTAGTGPLLGADPARRGFLVGGGSAGGNIAAVLAHMARDEGLSPPLTGQYLCVPSIICFLLPSELPEKYRGEYLSHPSVTPNIDPVLITNDGNPAVELAALLSADMGSHLMAPIHYGKGSEKGEGHKGVPPAYFQICGVDPLRDEGLIYERILREEAGVETKLDLYPGFGHYFWTNFPLLQRSREFVEDSVKGVRWLLEQQSAV